MFPAPIVPFIRESNFAVRHPWNVPERRLLDYLLIYIQEGYCLITVEGEEYPCREGDFVFVQPNEYHTLQGMTKTITPYAHLDIFTTRCVKKAGRHAPARLTCQHICS